MKTAQGSANYYLDVASGIRCEEIATTMGYTSGNVFRYLFRLGRKPGQSMRAEVLRMLEWLAIHSRQKKTGGSRWADRHQEEKLKLAKLIATSEQNPTYEDRVGDRRLRLLNAFKLWAEMDFKAAATEMFLIVLEGEMKRLDQEEMKDEIHNEAREEVFAEIAAEAATAAPAKAKEEEPSNFFGDKVGREWMDDLTEEAA